MPWPQPAMQIVPFAEGGAELFESKELNSMACGCKFGFFLKRNMFWQGASDLECPLRSDDYQPPCETNRYNRERDWLWCGARERGRFADCGACC